MNKPDFFQKGFHMVRKLYCETCKCIEEHYIEVIAESPRDNVVHCQRSCLVCYEKYKKLEALEIECKSPMLYQRFYTAPYVFLVLHKDYLD